MWHYLYTGNAASSDEDYEAATDAAGDYVHDDGALVGFYLGIGVNEKWPGYGSLAGQAGLTGTWTIDNGLGGEIDLGAGLQERGQNSLGAFTSQTIGFGGSYQFYSQDSGFQLPSRDNVQFPGIYGGTANSVGGANFVIPISTTPTAIGINYGPVYGGILIDPSKVWGNFVDSFHVIMGTFGTTP